MHRGYIQSAFDDTAIIWPQLTASLFLTALAVATIEQAVSCCTTVENSVRSRFMNSKASDDCKNESQLIDIKLQSSAGKSKQCGITGLLAKLRVTNPCCLEIN